MRAALTDRRPVVPPSAAWNPTGAGAYVDGADLVLPQVGSNFISPLIPVHGLSGVRWAVTALVPAGTIRYVYFTSAYIGADRTTRVRNSAGHTSNGYAPGNFPEGQWDTQLLPAAPIVLGPNVHFLRLAVLVSSSYGAPGTRIRPEGILRVVP